MDALTNTAHPLRPVASEFESTGFAFCRALLAPREINRIRQDVETSAGNVPRHGIRNAEKKFSTIDALASAEPVLRCVRPYLTGPPRLLRAIYFDKTPETNWYVTWHQDKTLAVPERFEAHGWGPWSVKDGIPHVQPPRNLLERMVTLRVHLDDTCETNGCLQVIPGTHRSGVLQPSDIETIVARTTPIRCEAEAGDALIMRPLLLHASRRGTAPSHRRIVHLEYGDFPTP